MDRREALSKVALLLGGTIIGGNLFIDAACNPPVKGVRLLFQQDYIALLDEIGETILPAGNTPGAKDAHIGEFMGVMVRDCYTSEDQGIFLNGLKKLDEICENKYNQTFMKCDKVQRTALLNSLDKEQRVYTAAKNPGDPNHFFRMLKELTVLGFFTSQPGATKALRYVEIPGRYEGSLSYRKGDRAWAI